MRLYQWSHPWMLWMRYTWLITGIGMLMKWPHVWCWPPCHLNCRNSMSIWMLKRSWCTFKSYLVHNLDMRGIKPLMSYSNVKWLKVHQLDPTCYTWSIWFKNWHDWVLHESWAKYWHSSSITTSQLFIVRVELQHEQTWDHSTRISEYTD